MTEMRDYWDAKARENAAYYVNSELEYVGTDLEAFWAGGPTVVDRMLEHVGAPAIRPEDDVVEIGCGIGRLTRVLAERGATVRALDVSAEMLDRARAANPGLDVEWILGDGTALTGVEDESADIVFSFVVFQHIPDPAVTLGYVREMGRVLRPGGWAAFQISNDPAVHRARPPKLSKRVLALVGRAPRGRDHPAWLGSAVSIEALREAASDGGLEVAQISGEGTQFCLVRLRKPAG